MAPPKPPDLPVIQHLGSDGTHAQLKTTEINRPHPTSRSHLHDETGNRSHWTSRLAKRLLDRHIPKQPDRTMRQARRHSQQQTMSQSEGARTRYPPPDKRPRIRPNHIHSTSPCPRHRAFNHAFDRPDLPNHSNHPEIRGAGPIKRKRKRGKESG
jgi:hypothetical protein